jgi:hypothetical protein
MKLIPLYDGDQNVGSAPLITNLDTWDGMRWRFQQTGCHLGIGRLDDGRYYTCYSSDWPEGIVRRKRDDGTLEVFFRCSGDFGPPALAVVISEEEARELMKEYKEEVYEEMFGEGL